MGSPDKAAARPRWAMARRALWVLVPLLILALSPEGVEQVYVPWVGRPLTRSLAVLTGMFSWSLAEWIEGAAATALIVFIGRVTHRVWQGRTTPRQVLSRNGPWALAAVLWIVAVFYASWGLNYARAPAYIRLGWEPIQLDELEDPDELRELAAVISKLTRETYLEIHGSEDAGAPTDPPPYLELHRAIEQGYMNATSEMGLPDSYARPFPPPKPLISSWLFTRLGISGFYFPFTGEANFNHMPPAWAQPMTLAHEKAHQRGVASEDEANFFGFLACLHSPDPHVRYAALMFAERQLLYPLFYQDPDAAIALHESRLPGMQRDRDASRAFWLGHDSAWTEVGGALNHAYLRINRVEGGTRSYSMSGRLMVSLNRRFPIEQIVSP